MDANFPACMQVVLQSEGGFVADPADPGGVTNLGVTIAVWSAHLGRAATIAEMEALTVADVTPLYRSEYWSPAHCPALPAGVDLMAFDCAVNSGVGRAIKTLQGAAGVTADGAFGPATAAAVARVAPADLIHAFATARETFYRSLPTFSRFGRGWLARLGRTEQAALGMTQP